MAHLKVEMEGIWWGDRVVQQEGRVKGNQQGVMRRRGAASGEAAST